jgi:hypothetical protein
MKSTRTERVAATAFAVGALWHITSCVRALVHPTASGSSAFAHANNLGSIAHLLWLAGIVTLAVTTWTTSGRLARTGYAIAAMGLVLIATAELIIGWSYNVSLALFTISVPVNAVGMTCLGIAVARSREGVTRFATAAVGVYAFAIIIPVFAIFGAPNYPALIGWGVTWLLFAVATWNYAGRLAGQTPVHTAAAALAER